MGFRTSTGRWKHVYQIAKRVLERPAAERAALLQAECGGDPELEQSVWKLVQESLCDSTFLEFSPFDEAPDLTSPGTLIGPWQVERELGRGGMGLVYLARRADGHFQKQVAIKLVHTAGTSELRERLRREREILAALEHPGIARLLDGGETSDGAPYLVMEYVDGLPLNEYVRQHRPSLRRRLDLFIEICQAVEYAHARAVAHRDLKPTNILVTADGRPRLLDFGIAKVMAGVGHAADLTAAGAGQMTLAYASPEQANGQPVTIATDVYSLGVLLYEIITGELPYDVRNKPLLDAVRIVCHQRPRPAGELAPEARGDLASILAHAMEKDSELRYGSVLELRQDLERYLAGRAVAARGNNWLHRASRFVHRNALKLAIASTTLLLLGAASGIAYRQRLRGDLLARQVHDFAESTIRTYRSLNGMPGATPLRVRIAHDAARYLDGLYNEAPASDGIANELAQAYRYLAEVQGCGFQHIGEFAQARQSIDRAIALRRELVRRNPSDVSYRYSLAQDLNRRAAVDEYSWSQYYEKSAIAAVEAFDALPPDWQARQDVRRDLIAALAYRAWAWDTMGHTDKALECERRRMRVAGSLVQEPARTLQDVILLSDSHTRVSVYLYSQRRYLEAVPYAWRGVDLLRSAAGLAARASTPDQLRYRFKLAAALKGVGKPEVLLANYATAARVLEQAAEGCGRLNHDDPADRTAANCAVESLLWQARAAQLSGHDRKAREATAQFVESTGDSLSRTPPGEDADPFTLEYWEQAADWRLPLDAARKALVSATVDQLPARKLSGPNWRRVAIAGSRWIR